MRVELRVEARHDLLEGAWFYEQQREGLGDYFTDCLFEDLERLEREAGIHASGVRPAPQIVEAISICDLLQD